MNAELYVAMRLRTRQYDNMAKQWIREISPTPPRVGEGLLDTLIAWDAPVEEWLEKAEMEGLFPPDELRHPTTDPHNVKMWIVNALNYENATPINKESEVTKVGGRFGYSERDGYLIMHFGYSDPQEGVALVGRFGEPARLLAERHHSVVDPREWPYMESFASMLDSRLSYNHTSQPDRVPIFRTQDSLLEFAIIVHNDGEVNASVWELNNAGRPVRAVKKRTFQARNPQEAAQQVNREFKDVLDGELNRIPGEHLGLEQREAADRYDLRGDTFEEPGVLPPQYEGEIVAADLWLFPEEDQPDFHLIATSEDLLNQQAKAALGKMARSLRVPGVDIYVEDALVNTIFQGSWEEYLSREMRSASSEYVDEVRDAINRVGFHIEAL